MTVCRGCCISTDFVSPNNKPLEGIGHPLLVLQTWTLRPSWIQRLSQSHPQQDDQGAQPVASFYFTLPFPGYVVWELDIYLLITRDKYSYADF